MAPPPPHTHTFWQKLKKKMCIFYHGSEQRSRIVCFDAKWCFYHLSFLFIYICFACQCGKLPPLSGLYWSLLPLQSACKACPPPTIWYTTKACCPLSGPLLKVSPYFPIHSYMYVSGIAKSDEKLCNIYMFNQGIFPLQLWVRIRPFVMCTRYNVIWSSVSVSSSKSVFIQLLRFPPPIKL